MIFGRRPDPEHYYAMARRYRALPVGERKSREAKIAVVRDTLERRDRWFGGLPWVVMGFVVASFILDGRAGVAALLVGVVLLAILTGYVAHRVRLLQEIERCLNPDIPFRSE